MKGTNDMDCMLSFMVIITREWLSWILVTDNYLLLCIGYLSNKSIQRQSSILFISIIVIKHKTKKGGGNRW